VWNWSYLGGALGQIGVVEDQDAVMFRQQVRLVVLKRDVGGVEVIAKTGGSSQSEFCLRYIGVIKLTEKLPRLSGLN
jgi:hypothetical protein